uniref:Uncharacterized protein n=1 Tax=Lepeophtheirus salmonis TaxID=72036 RepID=A0A0K2V6E0_LEPSM
MASRLLEDTLYTRWYRLTYIILVLYNFFRLRKGIR